MKKLTLIVFLALGVVFQTFSQKAFADRVILYTGLSGEFFSTPLDYIPLAFTKSVTGDEVSIETPLFSRQFGGAYEFLFQFNAIEISDEMSISIDVPLKLGLSTSLTFDIHEVDGYGYFASPLTLSYNYGLGSTYMTGSDFGFNIGVGANLLLFPIVLSTDENLEFHIKPSNKSQTYDYYGNYNKIDYRQIYITPVFKLGFSFWNNLNTVSKAGFLLYYSKQGTYNTFDYSSEEKTHRTMFIAFTYGVLLNY